MAKNGLLYGYLMAAVAYMHQAAKGIEAWNIREATMLPVLLTAFFRQMTSARPGPSQTVG